MKAVKAFLYPVILLLLACAAAIAADGLRDDARASDVGVVLGSKVMPDGTPSGRLQARLDRAAELYRQGLVRHIIVSGGTGKEGFSEARVMADYLAGRQAIPRAAILLDEAGNTTEATARNSAALMKAHGYTSAIVVTQFFHITRSRYALQRAGAATVHGAHARYAEARDAYSLARELVALPAYWLEAR
ncbi:vancomycin permeability regulator SanA [Pseudoduganella lurida]|uniref:Vancomycin permeability regulator SanA n=1 Tax=Pseudoduganella lurida TaxID=1036180 RepID=A0A562R2Z2_9BURK|nr:YdcF family protein [Pseudoduganella lurida]TWI63431.1 vancomycin permeability regulator SanA [Pseudoduganella lurida]